MFCKDSLIKMADGSNKKVSLASIGDYIINKFNHSVKITRIHILNNQKVIKIILDNDLPKFYTLQNTKFLCHNTNDGVHTSFYSVINNIDIQKTKLKSSLKIFSPESDITINSYELLEELVNVYCLHTNDSTCSLFINNCIVSCNEC